MSQFELCLLDCQSIQGYVFGSNKLRTNIGASANVVAIFEEMLKKVLDESLSLDDWKKNSHHIAIFNDMKMKADIGYVGGGNALLIFRKNGVENPAKEFVKQWTRQVLINFPGIVPAAAIGDTFEEPAGKNITDELLAPLFRKLCVEKNKGIPLTTLLRHGITAECKVTGLSAELFDDDKNVKAWTSSANISKTNTAKTVIAAEFSDEAEIPEFKESGKVTYRYAHTEEKLGQTEAHNHIAVIHIDGNSMGNQFQNCSSLATRRELSVAVQERTNYAWKKAVKDLLAIMPELIYSGVVKPEKSEDNKYDLLPLRKLILNGDDLTFICNAQIAFWLTEAILQYLTDKTLDYDGKKLLDREQQEVRMSACAGITIVKTKFPFYRAYQLAEELCGEAKKHGRAKTDSMNIEENHKGESWIDFEIVYGGLSGDLEQIRKKKYYIGNDKLILRPWRLFDEYGKKSHNNAYDWLNLKTALSDFIASTANGNDKWPRSKRKELLQRISRGINSFSEFEKILNTRKLKLANVCTFAGEQQRMQFYYDSLQVSEFYPNDLL